MIKRNTRILFPEGSSLSARQALNALGGLGYRIDICDPDPICICRFSKYVHKYYQCPQFGKNPIGYLNFIIDLIKKENYDVLIPIHEQAFLFSKAYNQISKYTNIAISGYQVFSILQSKVEFMKLLERLNIPHPKSQFIRTKEEIESIKEFPCYMKLAYGTAGHGTWRISNKEGLFPVLQELDSGGYFDSNSELLVQNAVSGNLCVTQSLFDKGKMISAHCYRLRSEGVGGSASARVGVNHPMVIEHLRQVGEYLDWQGCLMLDYLFDNELQQPFYIEANPRPGETMNATLSGFNIIESLIEVSLGRVPKNTGISRCGVKTHSLMATLLGIASRGGNRRMLISEIGNAILHRRVYANSFEDLTNIKGDFLSIIPVVVIAIKLLIEPKSAGSLSQKAIVNYSLTPDTVKIIEGLVIE
ncbi:carbamoyl-phosphate synthase large chain [Peptococcaceae bacterium CEB3]|nr:carbamoyl-phosphate synthase large chain [Peptococcaceae bacterium CEB3]